MGILNITPDSFSDGGLYLDPQQALDHAQQMMEAGAHILDLGAESSRPGAVPIQVEEEWRRLEPVLTQLISKSKIPVSVDTRHREVATRALSLGAEAINDISGGAEPSLLQAVKEFDAGIVLMHMRGSPQNMMEHAQYKNVIQDVQVELKQKIEKALQLSIKKEKICIDPGFGFAKLPRQNYELLWGLKELKNLGFPILAGLSRKRMLREIVGSAPEALKAVSVTAALMAVQNGANIIRVHDVAATVAALKLAFPENNI